MTLDKRHRHRWQRRTTLTGGVGLSYVWYRCECGARRVETLDAGASVVARRYVKGKQNPFTTKAVIPGPGTIKTADFDAAVAMVTKKGGA
jgi:hypothetical protein